MKGVIKALTGQEFDNCQMGLAVIDDVSNGDGDKQVSSKYVTLLEKPCI
jgi:hypothetical protein